MDHFNKQEDWLAVFDENGVKYVVLDREDDGAITAILSPHPGWTVDIQDEDTVIFGRAA